MISASAKRIILFITGHTNYDFENLDIDGLTDPGEICKNQLAQISSIPYSQLKKKHEADFSALMKTVSFSLGENQSIYNDTYEELKHFNQTGENLGIIPLYFQFGRYLLLSSSTAPGKLPANLQGIWNFQLVPPWNSDFHTNINLQMNYWPVDVANVSSAFQSYQEFIEKLEEPGRQTAKIMFGCEGWAVNHCTDAFGKTGIHDGPWGIFPLAGAWLTFPMWRHYEFNHDSTYLKKRAWPMMKAAAEFALDFLIENKNGNLVTVPSQSPENPYIDPNPVAALKWVLKDPNICSIIPGYTTFDQIETDVEIMYDIELTPEEEAELQEGRKLTGLFCQGCGTCKGTCRNNLPVHDLMRAYMYAYGYPDLEKARYVLDTRNISTDPCKGCLSCTVQCARKFPVKERIEKISRLSGVPKDFIV